MLGKRGFTLIELLIVIAVISILIGIALPRFRGMREEGMIAQAKGELRTLQTAVESFRIHTGAYPTVWPDDIEGATPDIIGPDAPTDPFNTGQDYQYATDAAGPILAEYYVIWSVGLGVANGVCTVSTAGLVTQTTPDPIYVTNGHPRDTTP